MNQSESETIAQSLIESGSLRMPGEAAADLCIVNTCSVTQRAAMQSRQAVRRAIRTNPEACVLVTGCCAQTEPKEFTKIKGVRAIIGHTEKHRIPQIVHAMKEEKYRVPISIGKDVSRERIFRHVPVVSGGNRTRPILKIQDGCDASCTYCVVPLARGPSRSMPVETVLNHIRQLKGLGYHEVVLSGIHLGCYGLDLHPAIRLCELLHRILEAGVMHRVRLSSIEPLELTDGILKLAAEANAEYGSLCHHFHIPLQSGDDFILNRMKRPYDRLFFRDLIQRIDEKIPDVAIGVDILIGFPGETENAFQNTYDLIEALPIAYLHVFPFSPRKGTPAATYDDKVPENVIKERSRRMRELGNTKRAVFLARFIGQAVEVLIEGKKTGPNEFFKGVTSNYIPVFMKSHENLENSLVIARIEQINGSDSVFGVKKIKKR